MAGGCCRGGSIVYDFSDNQLDPWHIHTDKYLIQDFFKATSTNLGIIFLLWDVEWMVRAKLSTRKPGNNRKNEHDIGMVPYTSWSIGSNRMELQENGFKLTTTKPANKLLVPQHTLALILFHVLLVRVPGREIFFLKPLAGKKELKTDQTFVQTNQWWAPSLGALVWSPLAPPRTRPREGTCLSSPKWKRSCYP